MPTLVLALRYSDAVFPRHPRLFGRVFVVLAVSLWISTVYQRNHWNRDCVAGIAIGATSTFLAGVVRRGWPRPTG